MNKSIQNIAFDVRKGNRFWIGPKFPSRTGERTRNEVGVQAYPLPVSNQFETLIFRSVEGSVHSHPGKVDHSFEGRSFSENLF